MEASTSSHAQVTFVLKQTEESASMGEALPGQGGLEWLRACHEDDTLPINMATIPDRTGGHPSRVGRL